MELSTPSSGRALVRPEDRVPPSQPGAKWWMYERPPRSTVPSVPGPPLAAAALPSLVGAPAEARPWTQEPSGRTLGLVAAGALLAAVIGTRVLHNESLGVVLIPAAGVAATVAFGQRCQRVHPDEPWLPRILLLAVVAKLVASWVRYVTLTNAYENIGDAARYDIEGRRFVAAWTGLRPAAPQLDDLRGTNFLKWLTGVDYYVFGQNLLAGFLLFGLFAFVGSYFWYRALADGVPSVDKRLFLIFVMFAPSIVFWPSSLGKDALMQLGVGGLAWAIALILTGRASRAVPLALGAGWLVWVVRPHLLALVVLAGAIPYFLGRIDAGGRRTFLARPAGMIVIGVLVSVTVAAGAQFVGVDDLSFEGIQAQLDEQTKLTSRGGSAFEHGGNSLSPLSLPLNVVTVLFRPFPWEAGAGFGLLAAVESAILIVIIASRRDSLAWAWRRLRLDPFVLFCLVFVVLYAMTYSSFANFGLLTRQRSLVLPALYGLIALEPALTRRAAARRDLPEPARPGG